MIEQPILSILIPSTHDRNEMLQRLLKELLFQIQECNATEKVEIVTDIDNREKLIGDKRNDLLSRATGIYQTSIDSDDWIASNYISEILKAAKEDCDCISINGWMETNGGNRISWRISKDNPYCAATENGQTVYLRFHNHLGVVKTEIAKQFKFESVSFSEDYKWALQMHNAEVLKTEAKTEGELYFYRYSTIK